METVKLIISLLCVIIPFLTAAITLGMKLSASNKARKEAEAKAENAKTEEEKAKAEAEREKAENDMLATAHGYVEAAEGAFKGIDAVMKKQGSSAGAMKKENVFTKLQTYALQRGYEFDAAYWLDKIDKIVAFTRNVNAKENAENTNKTA